MANLQITFRPYRRAFREALRTSRGEWSNREGFILRVEKAGRTGYGEVAPVPEFGSETVEAARTFLRALEAAPSQPIPKELPCCAFALSSALSGFVSMPQDYPVAGLLPAGESAIHAAGEKSEMGYRTLKWKVGVEPLLREQDIFQSILEAVPQEVKFRLDANGAWSVKELENWIAFLQPIRERIEFIEQALPTGAEAEMAECSAGSGIAIALDESLNGQGGLRWLENWDGPLVIKPLLMSDCHSLIERLQPLAERIVLSSVFETGVGLLNVLQMADALPGLKYALGFDTLHFSDDLSGRLPSALLKAEERAKIDPEALWKQLPQLT